MRLMSQMQQDQSSPLTNPSGDDPLASLHKMSTTAGLGSTDYVAVNPTAIFAVIIGLLSAFTLFEEPILLLIPAIGVIVSIVSFRQIGRSNGTQTGRGLATIALLLCFGFGGVVAARTVVNSAQERRDKADLDTLIKQFSTDVTTADFTKAYDLFDERFQKRIPPPKFNDTMKAWSSNTFYGKITQITWRNLAVFQYDESTNEEMAAISLVFNYDKVGEVRQDAFFRKMGTKWMLDDIPAFFPPPKNPNSPGGM